MNPAIPVLPVEKLAFVAAAAAAAAAASAADDEDLAAFSACLAILLSRPEIVAAPAVLEIGVLKVTFGIRCPRLRLMSLLSAVGREEPVELEDSDELLLMVVCDEPPVAVDDWLPPCEAANEAALSRSEMFLDSLLRESCAILTKFLADD